MKRLAAAGAVILAAAVSASGTAHAQPAAEAPAGPRVVIDPDGAASGINPTGQPVVLTAPLMDGPQYLGDITLTLEPDGRATFSAARLIALLEPRLRADRIAALRAARQLGRAELDAAGIAVRYDPQALQVDLVIAAGARGTTSVTLGDDQRRTGIRYVAPADVSAYLNIRGSLDWVQQGDDDGLQAPLFFIDGAARVGGVVLEGEANWQPGTGGVDFQRRGSRLVYDDRDNIMRWTGGDLQTLARGFQSAPEIAGLSVSRLYSLLEPQTIIRPRGNRSFQIERRSLVEVRVNNQLVRRLELDPGSYDLTDFPFTQGSNDVRLTVTDDTGRTASVNFDIFLDQSQLAEGLSEFGLYAGVLAPLGRRGPRYSDDLAVSGFYRRGVSQNLTLGANGQADGQGWMAGVEGVFATPIGSFAGFASASHVGGFGEGWAGILTFQRTIARKDNRNDTLSFSLEARSRDFGPIGTRVPNNPYGVIVGANYTTTFSDTLYGGLDARYSQGRDAEPDVASLRGTLGWRITPRLSFTGDAAYERDARGERFTTFLTLTLQLDRRSNLRADYDSRFNRGRLAYQRYGGTGTGAYTMTAEVERSDVGAGAAFNGTYYSNRAELALSHFGTFERDLGGSTGQRTSLRFGTAIAMADGAVTIGRPIQDAFALVEAHPALRRVGVLVDPSGRSEAARTGALGTALQPSLSSYSERTILVAAPNAPLATDLGEGAFRLLPPYRAGYRLRVGSDYNVSVVGRLLDASGAPITLISGTATELAHPDREPIALFTTSTGRFGVTGLAPGRWRITLADSDATSFEIVIPAGAEGALQIGDQRPAAQ